MTDELTSQTATDLRAGFERGDFSPVDTARACLDRIAALDPLLNAYCFVDEESVIAQARAAEQRWHAGAPQGPLDGVPVSIKDLLLTRDWPTLRGSKTTSPDANWSEDSPPVARLRESGAILLGKTTTPEFAWKGVTDSPLTGITRNPWNPDYTPGGSSGGAAAAVAAGMGPLALGTDAGGSLRIPAAMCGLFTIKPSGGRVPSYPPTPYGSFAASGPISWSVKDAALLLRIIAAADWRDWSALPPGACNYESQLELDGRSLRIGWSADLGFAEPSPELVNAGLEARRRLERLGHSVVDIDPPFDDPTAVYETLRAGMTVSAFAKFDDTKLALMDPGLAIHIEESRSRQDLSAYLRAEVARNEIGRAMCHFHTQFDLMMTPALATSTFMAGIDGPPGKPGSRQWSPYTFPFNLTRQPAVVLPCGNDENGLPLGVQLVGALYAEHLLLQVSRQYEQAYPWERKRAQPHDADAGAPGSPQHSPRVR